MERLNFNSRTIYDKHMTQEEIVDVVDEMDVKLEEITQALTKIDLEKAKKEQANAALRMAAAKLQLISKLLR